MAKRYFEFVGNDAQRGVTSSKFWEVEVTDNELTVRFGKIGAEGQTTVKTFPSAEAANSEAEKLIAAKTKKGYSEKSV